ncbi:MAG: dihydroneopterin aldolase [Chitinophagaceae bacterium]|nr:MAG: dihydroneopterin aldolase [Chitinophagaceae bacterium]
MVTIRLDQVRLHGLHGVYVGEPLVGGDFEVSLDVTYEDKGINFTNLSDTISYVDLYGIVQQRMNIVTPLLEKIAKDILDEIGSKYPHAIRAGISIIKLQPPVIQFHGRLGVTMLREY